MTDMLERVEDYLTMGVLCVWVIDPRSRRGFEYTRDGMNEARGGVLRVNRTPIEVPLSAIFE